MNFIQNLLSLLSLNDKLHPTMKRFALVVLLLCGAVLMVVAQPTIPFIKVEVRPDHTDWLYSCGEKPQFAVEVTTCSNAPVENVEVSYEVSEDMLPPLAKGKMVLRDGKTVIKGYTMRKPGFLRCRIWATVDGKTYEECATAGFDVDTEAQAAQHGAWQRFPRC